jgi:hypothetical protein
LESKNPNSKFLRQSNAQVSTPTTSKPLQSKQGVHTVAMKDEFGIVGLVEYEMDEIAISHDPVSADELGGNLLQLLQEEEMKSCGKIIRVLIHPQAILISPL